MGIDSAADEHVALRIIHRGVARLDGVELRSNDVAHAARRAVNGHAVAILDAETGQVADGDPLLPTTLARRGFSLGSARVAWVGASNDNVDGELRVRAWTTDGVGNLRVVSPEQEEVLPAF